MRYLNKVLITALALTLLVGIGLAADEISNCTELQEIENDLTRDYVLVEDINCSDIDFSPIGNGTAFSGELDGDDHEITGINIQEEEEDQVGLFEKIDGDVKNLEIKNAYIVGNNDVGILTGKMGSGLVENTLVSGEVYGMGNNVGGLIGYSSEDTDVKSSGAFVEVNGEGNHIGGLIGQWNHAFDEHIENVYVIGSVSGSSDSGKVGGLAGRTDKGHVEYSYVSVEVSDGDPFIGFVDDTQIKETYYDTDVNGDEDDNAEALFTDEMIGEAAEEHMDLNYDTRWNPVIEGEEIAGITPSYDNYPIFKDYHIPVESQINLLEEEEDPSYEEEEPSEETVELPDKPLYEELDEDKEHVADSEIISSMFYNPSLVGDSNDIPWRVGSPDSTTLLQGTYTQKEIGQGEEIYYDVEDNAEIYLGSGDVYNLAWDVENGTSAAMVLKGGGTLNHEIEINNAGECYTSPDQCIDSMSNETIGNDTMRFYATFSPDEDMYYDGLQEVYMFETVDSGDVPIKNIQLYGDNSIMPGLTQNKSIEDIAFHHTSPYHTDQDKRDDGNNTWRTWRNDMHPATMSFIVNRSDYGSESDLGDLWLDGMSQITVLDEWGGAAAQLFKQSTSTPSESINYYGNDTYIVETNVDERLTDFIGKDDQGISYLITMGEDITTDDREGYVFHEAVQTQPTKWYPGEIHPTNADNVGEDFIGRFKNIYHGDITQVYPETVYGENIDCYMEGENTSTEFDKKKVDIDDYYDYEETEFTAPIPTGNYTVSCEGSEDHLNPLELFFKEDSVMSSAKAYTCPDWDYYPGEEVTLTAGVEVSGWRDPGRYSARLQVGDSGWKMNYDDVDYVNQDILFFEKTIKVPEDEDSYEIAFRDDATGKTVAECGGKIESDEHMPLLYSDYIDIETTDDGKIRNTHNLDFGFNNTENANIGNVSVRVTPETSKWFKDERHMSEKLRPKIQLSWNSFMDILSYVGAPEQWDWIVPLDEREMWTWVDEFSSSESYNGSFTSMDANHYEMDQADTHVIRSIPRDLFLDDSQYGYSESLTDSDIKSITESVLPVDLLLRREQYGATRITVTYDYASENTDWEYDEVRRTFYAQWKPTKDTVEYGGVGDIHPRNKEYTGLVSSKLREVTSAYSGYDEPVIHSYLPWNWIREDPLVFIMVVLMFIVFAPLYMALVR